MQAYSDPVIFEQDKYSTDSNQEPCKCWDELPQCTLFEDDLNKQQSQLLFIKEEELKPSIFKPIHDDEPWVVLVSEEEFASMNYQSEKCSSSYSYTESLSYEESEEEIEADNSQSTELLLNYSAWDLVQTNQKNWAHIKFDLNIIRSKIDEIIQKQHQVDTGSYRRKGPGRHRINKEKTSSQLNTLIKGFFRHKFTQLSKNRKCKKRMDAVITFYLRTLKKCAYFLIEKTAAKNMYKRKEPSEYWIAYAESLVSFLTSINLVHCQDYVKSFCEWIVVYFPVAKCNTIINNLRAEGALDATFLNSQQEILEARDVTSKHNIKRWSSNSKIFKELVKISREVLVEPKFAKSGTLEHLVTVADDIIGK